MSNVKFIIFLMYSIISPQLFLKAITQFANTITTHGVFVGSKNNQRLSVLGAGQIDKYGNINSSRTSDGNLLISTGGANNAVNANEVILILNQSRKRFIEMLPYVTSKGDNVSKVISSMGIFTKAPGKNELCFKACFPDLSEIELEKAIKKI